MSSSKEYAPSLALLSPMKKLSRYLGNVQNQIVTRRRNPYVVSLNDFGQVHKKKQSTTSSNASFVNFTHKISKFLLV